VGVLGNAAVRLRERLGESLPSIRKNNAPLEQATTPSLDALNAFEKGLEAAYKGSKEEAEGHFKRALELDPNFAMAYVELAEYDWNNGEFEMARKNELKAYELRDRVTELERTYIEFFQSLFVTGDLERAKQTYELALRKYPPTLRLLNDLGLVCFSLGQYTEAEPMFRGSLRLAQTDDTILNLVVTLTGLNRLAEADALVASALPPNVQTDRLLTPRYWLAFLHGDTGQMQRLVSQSNLARNTLLAYQADTDAWSGHFRKSREDRSEAAKISERDGDRESAANTWLTGAVWESEVGNRVQAKSYASKALGLSRSLDSVTPLAALVMAKTGDTRQALLLADQLAKERPLDTLVQKYWIPLVKAQVELQQGRWMGAIQTLQLAEPLDYAVPGGFENSLYPPYVRGEAWLAGKDGVKAAIEFQKLIDHPGMLLNSPLGALAYLGQARAYVLASQPEKAQAAYTEFFYLWKDADPEIPILRTARGESARLPAGPPVR
jgi:tetratricopeptide (TPR) repeat protein